ncbi:nicotinamide N-methyltransferase-like [Mizuhopecten yessoensis]|uniref:Phenylethanolamine N-methyltransferase n=1 Tax=Mizuhopecten yessoensis TaxID=6573 RepID=A0A210Q4R6_MIZYE|nr:nicotinamide N-methyltransferase-like [Mizuhopecten yessoensis]OWF43732.1 Phenylethanolamine N-methyltransferase [Mizuhopecten yessoensis]
MATKKETTNFDDFDPERYMKDYYDDASWLYMEGEDLPFAFNELHRAFSSFQLKGNRLLDIGTGPSIHSIISASSHVDEIYLSDYSPKNRKYLQKWKEGDINFNEGMIKYLLRLEGSKTTAADRQKQMRIKVKDIFHIDIKTEQPLGSNNIEKFDIITSSYCLEAVTHSLNEFHACIHNIASLLKINGHIIVAGELEASRYVVGDYKFKCVAVSQSDVYNSFEQAGFRIESFREMSAPNPGKDLLSDFKGAYVMVAKKVR